MMHGAIRSLLLLAAVVSTTAAAQTPVRKYIRFVEGGRTQYGLVEGSEVRPLQAAPWVNATPTARRVPLSAVRVLAPTAPAKVIAVGLNYQSHLGERTAATYPGLFAKLPTCIIASGDSIIVPADAKNVHYEGEMVIVIGKTASKVSAATAKAYVFGVTVGNDVSERDWQKNDLQWFRAKASDTFGPLGPMLVTGLNYDDLLLQTRLNGEVVQSQRTTALIFNVATIVSYVSQYVTLQPGDVIYTGTPGTTRPMKAGDVVEVELEGVGILRNRVTQAH